MAAARLINRLSERAPDRYRITLINAEPSMPYDRVQLSSVLAGERSRGDLGLIAPEAAKRILFFQGQRVKSISPATKRVMLADCSTIAYDKLVLATGSAPIRLPLPGADMDGVHTFRNLSPMSMLSQPHRWARDRHRRRSARPRSRPRTRQTRSRCHRRPPHALADGTPARPRGGRVFCVVSWSDAASPLRSKPKARRSSAGSGSRG